LGALLHFYGIPIRGPGFGAMSAGSIGREKAFPKGSSRVSAECGGVPFPADAPSFSTLPPG
jgi:hypothetical protein